MIVAFIVQHRAVEVDMASVASLREHLVEELNDLWNPTYRAWFPNGPDDPDSAILTVQIDRVEYWDVPSSRLVRLWGVVRALASGQPAEAGDHQTLTFGDAPNT